MIWYDKQERYNVNEMPSIYKHLFEEALLKNSVNDTDFNKACHEWVVAGGHYRCDDLRHDSMGRFSFAYYMKHFQHKFKLPSYRMECICTHYIEQNCFIYNEYNKTALVVGNCCVSRFLPNTKKCCEVCNIGHKRTTKNICKECEVLGKNILTTGKHKGLSLYDVFKKHPSYLIYVHTNFPTSMKSWFHEFVEKCYEKLSNRERLASIKRGNEQVIAYYNSRK